MLSFNGSSSMQLAPFVSGGRCQARALSSSTERLQDLVKSEMLAKIPPIVEAACKKAQPAARQTLTQQTEDLTKQLKTLDDKAASGWIPAQFTTDGLVMRGTIDLAPRRAIVVKTEKTAAEDAHSALESWIPGGRIDRFEWSWTWSGSGDPGTARRTTDRFLLRRPSAEYGTLGYGHSAINRTALPGLDGWGHRLSQDHRALRSILSPVNW